MPKMAENDLRAMLSAEHADAMASTNSSKLSLERSDALNYYNGDLSKDMPAAPGRSSAVSMDVLDTVEGLLPQIMEVLAGTDEVVKFEPVGPEDVQASEQETDYVNHVFMNMNDGYKILYDFVKDALLSKVGIVKVWWEKEDKEQRETYYDKTADEYALIVSNPDVEVVEHTEHPADGGAGEERGYDSQLAASPIEGATQGNASYNQPQQTLHDVTVVIKKTHAQARVMGVPPEEFGIERGARNIQDCNYCFHKVVDRTEAELITLGYDEKQVKRLPSYRAWTNTEEISRDTVDEHANAGTDDTNSAARTVEITEHYIRLDYEGNGKPCLYRVTTGGNQGEILKLNGKPDILEFDAVPFASATPIPVSHRFYGKSVADITMDIMRVKTALLRGGLDGLYVSNNPRVVVSESHTTNDTIDDLLVSRPNQIVRVKHPGGIEYQKSPDTMQSIYPALDYMDQRLEGRTGFSKRGQGLDSDALSNQSATASKIVENASQARVRLICRMLALGVRDLFWLLHATIKKHGEQAEVVRLRNQWVNVDPREWKTRDDLTVHVGLGTGGRAQSIAELTLIASMQKDALINGLTNLVTVDNLYSTGKELVKALGRPNVQDFFTDPKTQPPPQAKPDPAMIKAQADMQVQGQKAQLEGVKAQADTQHQIAKTQAEMALADKKFELEKQLAILNAQLATEKHQQDMALRMADHQGKQRERADNAEAKNGNARIEVKHSADELTGPLALVVEQLGQHLANSHAAQQQSQAAHTQAIMETIAQNNKPKRIKGPSGKVYHIEHVN